MHEHARRGQDRAQYGYHDQHFDESKSPARAARDKKSSRHRVPACGWCAVRRAASAAGVWRTAPECACYFAGERHTECACYFVGLSWVLVPPRDKSHFPLGFARLRPPVHDDGHAGQAACQEAIL